MLNLLKDRLFSTIGSTVFAPHRIRQIFIRKNILQLSCFQPFLIRWCSYLTQISFLLLGQIRKRRRSPNSLGLCCTVGIMGRKGTWRKKKWRAGNWVREGTTLLLPSLPPGTTQLASLINFSFFRYVSFRSITPTVEHGPKLFSKLILQAHSVLSFFRLKTFP